MPLHAVLKLAPDRAMRVCVCECVRMCVCVRVWRERDGKGVFTYSLSILGTASPCPERSETVRILDRSRLCTRDR